jgi:hypothetical protein
MRLSCLTRVITRLVYAALILLAAGMIGGGVMMVVLIAAEVILAPFTLANGFNGFGASALVGFVAFPFWLVGAFVVGPPLWAVLHFARLTGRRSAAIAGVLTGSLSVPTVLWMLDGGGVPTISLDSAAGVGLLSAAGRDRRRGRW